MRSVLALVALFACAPTAARAADRAVSKLPARFEVRPPQGFRPSDTALMLADSMATVKDGHWTPHAQLYPRASDGRTVIAVHPELLSSKDKQDQAGLRHVLGFAKDYKFSIVADDATPAQREALAEKLKGYGVDDLVVR